MNKYLEHIYLCYQKNKKNLDFECNKFKDYREADDFYNKIKPYNILIYSLMLPVPFYVPSCYHGYYLKKEISKKLVKVNINKDV